ncbi:MAG: phosphotransferase [Steroidobacteraceae bacterium]
MQDVAAIAAELGLERPRIVPLAGGPANRTLRLTDARHDYVLRLAGAATAVLLADRESELAMLRLASAAGLAPAIVLARPEAGLLVTQHLDGKPLADADLRNRATLRRIGAWIARLHAIPPPPELPQVDFGGRAAAYLGWLQARGSDARIAAVAVALDERRKALAPLARLASCHHDLHCRNFVDTGAALSVLDWEYAGPGDPAADLAACIGYHELAERDVDALLAGYGRNDDALRSRLAALRWIFDCLWFSWNAVAECAGLGGDPDLQRRLIARLAA